MGEHRVKGSVSSRSESQGVNGLGLGDRLGQVAREYRDHRRRGAVGGDRPGHVPQAHANDADDLDGKDPCEARCGGEGGDEGHSDGHQEDEDRR